MTSNQRSVLLIGGSGFVSGALARACVRAGHNTWAVVRGKRPAPEGVNLVQADRHDDRAFRQAIEQADRRWDLAVDCIAYEPADMRQDLAVLGPRVDHFVLISTDFVYDPSRRTFPQKIDNPCLQDETYGGKKRRCELELADSAGPMKWTIFRPCHIYGPGSLLGCLPDHGRDPDLLDHLRTGMALRLVGGGHFLQQPIFADDLARLILSTMGNPQTAGRIYPAAGPDIIESRRFYGIIADLIGTDLHVEELGVCDYLREHPEQAPFLCHRVYDLSALAAAGLTVPTTPIADGLGEHVRSLLQAEDG